jgi:hypothetical protein
LQKKFAGALHVINRSDSEDLKDSNIGIETRVHELYVVNNYISNIQQLPGVIELDVIDSFKMICRKVERLDQDVQIDGKKH